MCARIGKGLVLVIVVAFSTLGGCEQATDPEVGVSTAVGIAHLSIGPMNIEALVNVDDPKTIADVLSLLSEEQLSTLAKGDVVGVDDPKVALKIAARVGLDTSFPAAAEGGVLLSTFRVTWGQLKCCYGGNDECCPKKKEK
jgi:hypothetical protein